MRSDRRPKPEEPERYRFTADDDAAIREIATLVREHPKEFEEIGRALDARYSIERAQQRERLPLDEVQRRARVRRLKTRIAEAKSSKNDELVENLQMRLKALPKREDWDNPRKRFGRLVLADFLEKDLSLDLPAPGWEWAGRVLLVVWLLTDRLATEVRSVTEFQLPWRGGRDPFKHVVGDWPRVLVAARRALRCARERVAESDKKADPKDAVGLGQARRESAVPTDTESGILKALKAAAGKQGVTAKQLATKCSRSEDTIHRAVRRLQERGYAISNPRNRTGYFLKETEPRG